VPKHQPPIAELLENRQEEVIGTIVEPAYCTILDLINCPSMNPDLLNIA
jgi:hypothetical protein